MLSPYSPSLPVWQSQHHDEEKRALSREIIVLNNRLMEAKITIDKLRDDNVSMRQVMSNAPSVKLEHLVYLY